MLERPMEIERNGEIEDDNQFDGPRNKIKAVDTWIHM